MFKKTLIISDLSTSSEAAINCMSNLKSLGVEDVILFYACDVKYLDTIAELIKQSVESDLLKQKQILESFGLKTTIEIAPGIRSDELKRIIKEKDVSLIVIGSPGERVGSRKFFWFGGVTSDVLHNHEIPVLLIRTSASEEKGEHKIQSLYQNLKGRILFATDFSEISLQALLYVEKLVESGCKKVTLLHVQDKVRIESHLSDKLDEFNRIDSERLENYKKQLMGKGAEEIDIKIVYGLPSKEIIQASKEGYSLIVMGSQGRGFFKEIFIGSVSHNVARDAETSVILVPAKTR